MRLAALWHKILLPFRRVLVRSRVTSLGRGLVLFGSPILTRTPGSSITIGSNVVLCSTSRFTALGVKRPVVIRTLSSTASISIGNDVGISGGAICAAYSVVIGSRCLMGADVTVADTDFHQIDEVGRRYAPLPAGSAADQVVIEDDVFIGAGAVVLKGCRIGRGSVIGAGSVVTGEIPPFVVAAGVPCRVLRAIET